MALKDESVAHLKIKLNKDKRQSQPVLPGHSGDRFFNHQERHAQVPSQGKLLSISGQNKSSTSLQSCEPWKTNPRYFSSIQVSKLACLKILGHASRGGSIEIMGMLVGTTRGDQIIVFDSYELPVEGTETRVNAQSESYEYMVQYMSEMVPKTHTIVGWYHSHPGYDCWLSNIDMHTQDLNQNYQDPYVAIVVDPTKSMKEGSLAIGAFRTFHTEGNNDDESLAFYELNMDIFESRLDESFDALELKFKMPKVNQESESLPMSRLVDIMSQWNNLNQVRNNSLHHKKDPLTLSNLTRKMGEEDCEADQQSRQYNMFNRQTRSNSVASMKTSAEEDSDVDMNERHPEDTESLNSSVHTMTESSTPLGRPTAPPVVGTIRRSWTQALSGGLQRQHINTGSVINGPETLQRDALLLDYDTNKRDLIELKTREYRKLRYCRDTFTL